MVKEDKSKFERKQERRIKQTWATIFLLGATLMVFLVVYGWQIKDVGANGQVTYSSIEELNSNFYVNVYMPEKLLEYDDLTFEVYNEQVANIYNSNFVLKATAFLDESADVLGLYGNSEIDDFYRNSNAESGEIISVRYRTGYEEYPHCTLLNYCTDKVSYGLMLEDEMSIEEAFELLGIFLEDYTEVQSSTNTTEDEQGMVWFSSEVGERFIRFGLPSGDTESTVGTGYWNDMSYSANEIMLTVKISDEIVFMLIASTNIDEATLPEDGIKEELDNGLTAVYRSDNPFEEGTISYEEVKIIQDNIDTILDSVSYS